MKSLDRPFRLIAFDWDGTAVANRQEDASTLQHLLERLLNLDVRIVIITGTNFPNVDRQVSSKIFGAHKRDLYVCTNRGSEIYGFDARSRPRLIWRRLATATENELLSKVAERVRAWIESRTGLPVEVISDRLNRRKIDLIPLPEWRDPPKSEIGSLLKAVQQRLIDGGIAGGLRDVLAFAGTVCEEEGLPDPRITSDVKHIEVGLTDKGDSVDWMMREVAAKSGLIARDVLVAGDEFGPVDGFPGSDYLMLRDAAKDAAYVSVGPEPNGVPGGVLHLGGGPPRFRVLLQEQITKHEREVARLQAQIPADNWLIVENGFKLVREHEIESMFSIGNGYLGSHGSLSEAPSISRPATFVAGVFELPHRMAAVPELIKAPDWARLKVFVEGQELRFERGELLEHRRLLDMKRGVLLREWRQQDTLGRITRLNYFRFVSLADRHAMVESLTLMPENYGGTVVVENSLDGSVCRAKEVQFLSAEQVDHRPVLALRTLGSGTTIAMATATVLRPPIRERAEPATTRTPSSLTQRYEWPAEMGREYHVDKIVAVYTSRDVDDPVAAASAHLERLCGSGVQAIRNDHEMAWAERWQDADIAVEGDPDGQRALRFAGYHLIAAANAEDPRVSIGARGLTGEAYKGHVFWDTETFMLPFFAFTDPPTARALLFYRHRTLPASLNRARRMGYQGALYAWESTDTGEDVTPSVVFTPSGERIEILCGEMEHHISADVAYAVWQYWQATGDDEFLRQAGAEMLIETARFWASRGSFEADGRYHIRRVIGPDEYHEGVDDNAYTNGMAQWNLQQAAAVAAMLRDRWPNTWQQLVEQMGLEPGELEHWDVVARAMYTGFNPASGLFEQFQGYFDLDYVDLATAEPRTAPMDVILGRPRIQQTQVIKQADVVMLLHLFWERFPRDVREKNFRYYEPRCDHGSSLSPAIHSAVAARLGDVATAERYFRQAASIDLGNNMGNAASGVHMAAQGGLWQAVAFGFAGMRPCEGGLAFDLRLIPRWQDLTLPITWQGRKLRIMARRAAQRVTVRLESGEAMEVALDGESPVLLEPGRPPLTREWRDSRQPQEVRS